MSWEASFSERQALIAEYQRSQAAGSSPAYASVVLTYPGFVAAPMPIRVPTARVVVDVVEGEMIAEALSRMSRVELKEVRMDLRDSLRPMAEAARGLVHSVSGALRAALRVRMGSGDRPGRYSVFILATTTRGALARRKGGRRARLLLAGGAAAQKYRVWYARPLESGHAASGWYGQQAGAQPVPPHPFAQPAFDRTHDAVANAAGAKLLDRVLAEWA